VVAEPQLEKGVVQWVEDDLTGAGSPESALKEG
jgi:hypothetical protein